MAVPETIRRMITERAGGCCEYCCSREDYAHGRFSIEHIVPRSAGGNSLPQNLALSCQTCNSFKYTATTATDPATGETVPLFHPRRDARAEHFQWDGDEEALLGLTAAGRATILRLQLNRPPLMRMRRVLRRLGLHPPAI